MTPEGVFFVGRAERSETLSTAPKGDEIAGSIAAHLSALQMMDVEPDLFLFG